MTPTLDGIYLQLARGRLVVHLTEQIKQCLETLDEEQIWWRPNEGANAIGNLILHLCGSTRHFIGHLLGGSSFTRDREAEFTERQHLAKHELLRLLLETAEETDRVLTAFQPGRLLEPMEVMGKPSTPAQLILHVMLHYATHAGQIIYATKMMKTGAIHDIWRKTPTG